MAIPLILFGDAPGQPSGLSRILTDLALQLHVRREALGIEVATVGWAQKATTARYGNVGAPQPTLPWPAWWYDDFSTLGGVALEVAYRRWFGDRPGVVLSVWDAARIEALAQVDLPIRRWGYVPIDAASPLGVLTGPPAQWLRAYDRVLAYTPYGARVLQQTIGDRLVVEDRPHGLSPAWFEAPSAEAAARVEATLTRLPTYRPGAPLIGCVATNQRRKDLATFAAVVAACGEQTGAVGWLHTDQLITDAWCVPQLFEEFGITDRCVVTLRCDDDQLRAIYQRSAVTIAPGLGEGWGYPIAESLAGGTPALHVAYAGGADVAHPMDRIPATEGRYEGPYCQWRPTLPWRRFAEMAMQIIEWSELRRAVARDARRAHVLPWRWDQCWPAWESWVREGLAPMDGGGAGGDAHAHTTID